MRTHANTVVSLNALIAGLEKHYPRKKFSIDGTSYTTRQIVTYLRSIIADVHASVAAPQRSSRRPTRLRPTCRSAARSSAT
jgi:hypothetical protein